MVQATLYATDYTQKSPYWTFWEPLSSFPTRAFFAKWFTSGLPVNRPYLSLPTPLQQRPPAKRKVRDPESDSFPRRPNLRCFHQLLGSCLAVHAPPRAISSCALSTIRSATREAAVRSLASSIVWFVSTS